MMDFNSRGSLFDIPKLDQEHLIYISEKPWKNIHQNSTDTYIKLEK